MELDDAIKTRRSIRRFSPDPVSDTMIDSLLEAARLAPSGSNTQPWRFVVVKSPEMKEKFKSITRFRFALKASVLLVCCGDLNSIKTANKRVAELMEAGVGDDMDMDDMPTSSYRSGTPEMTKEQILNYVSLNVGIAITHIMLKAVDLGLGTCWIGGFDRIKTSEILELDDNIYPVALLPVGHHDRVPKQRPRISMEEIMVKTA